MPGRLEKLWMAARVGKDAARQVAEALRWMSGIAQPDDAILVEFPNYRRVFRFEFPLRYGDPPRVGRDGRPPSFTIRSRHTASNPDAVWFPIFDSPEIQILERSSRASGPQPLRWGLFGNGKLAALKLARRALEKFLATGERLSHRELHELPPRFHLKTDLDVALWTDGRLRGSWVVEDRPLAEGIAEAAVGASRDPRFKPLGAEELPRTRIEITLMSPLKIPLSRGERERNSIYPEKGYLLQHGSARGYYLPEIFNVRRFRNLEELLGDLAQEKAGLTRTAAEEADVFMFEVDDFIESEDHQRALALKGPIVSTDQGGAIRNSEEFVIRRLQLAADWLCRIQEPDGNIPPIIDPLTGRTVRQIDWPRLALTAWALAEFGKVVREERYIEAVGKSFSYLGTHILEGSYHLPPTTYALTFAYFGQLALALGKPREATDAGTAIWQRLDWLTFEPIAAAQIASFFKALSNVDRRFWGPFQHITKTLKERFEAATASNQPTNFAQWAELVNTFWGVDPQFSQTVADWLKTNQLSNGAFRESTTSDFIYTPTPNLVWGYTRGTSKIFEVLALDQARNRTAIEAVLSWLITLQYDQENMFFVPTDMRPKILGGFRHDSFNQEAWIDAAGHFLLGGGRLTGSQQRASMEP